MLTVWLRFRRPRYALEVELRAPAGVTLLIGPSGAGKSTTLDLLAGHLRPDAGRIALGDEVLFQREAGERAVVDVPAHRRRMGYVMQVQALFPHLDVAGNLRYGAFGLPRAERRARFERIVDELQLGALLTRRPESLSGGERQRVALGRALLPGPRVLLLDEPLSAVDEASRAGLQQRLRALCAAMAGQGVPVLYVTHGPADEGGGAPVEYRLLSGDEAPGGRVVRAERRGEDDQLQ